MKPITIGAAAMVAASVFAGAGSAQAQDRVRWWFCTAAITEGSVTQAYYSTLFSAPTQISIEVNRDFQDHLDSRGIRYDSRLTTCNSSRDRDDVREGREEWLSRRTSDRWDVREVSYSYDD